MRKLNARIGATKRKLVDMCSILDEIYSSVEADVTSKKKELKKKEITNTIGADKDRIALKITSRMVYLNKLHNVSKDIIDAKLVELSKLLDWIEEM